MQKYKFPEYLIETYEKHIDEILNRLKEFQSVKSQNDPELYFYEFCFCILTPQSNVKNAIAVQNKLIENDFFNKNFNPVDILSDRSHYIRFHNKKAERLEIAKDFFPTLMKILESDTNQFEKRINIKNNFLGIGMKESSHFLRNIGYKNLAILDRHILRHLKKCNVIDEIILPLSEKQYLEMENKFSKFCDELNISIDIMDFVFFANSTGRVLK